MKMITSLLFFFFFLFSSNNTYSSDIELQLSSDSNGVRAVIHVPELDKEESFVLRSVEEGDFYRIGKLNKNPEVMGQYLSGQPRGYDQIEGQFDTWLKRRKAGDFRHGLVGFDKEGNFIGYAVIGGGSTSDTCEFAGLMLPELQNKKYGLRAAYAMVYCMLPELLKLGPPAFGGILPNRIEATACKTNTASDLILTHLRFRKDAAAYEKVFKVWKKQATFDDPNGTIEEIKVERYNYYLDIISLAENKDHVTRLLKEKRVLL